MGHTSSRKPPKSEQAKRNRNNKERGKDFERRMAEALGFYRVPMSGTSAVFGWCDIRDCEKKEEGYWLGECKTMTPTTKEPTYTIKVEWLEKLVRRAASENKLPFLAFTLFADTRKLIAMPRVLFEMFDTIHFQVDLRIKRMSKEHINYTIPRSVLTDYKVRGSRSNKIIVIWDFGFEDEADGSGWVFMHLDDYMRFYRGSNLGLIREEFYAISKSE